MKNFNAKQSGSGVILEEVNPHDKQNIENISGTMFDPRIIDNPEYYSFTPLILTSIDPNIKVGDLIREDQLDIIWQRLKDSKWIDCEPCFFYPGTVRQAAKLKQGTEENLKRQISELIDENNELKACLVITKNSRNYNREKLLQFQKEHKPESEDSEQVRLINWIGTMYMTQHGAKNIHELMKKQGFEITKKNT